MTMSIYLEVDLDTDGLAAAFVVVEKKGQE
jgi:hypothetical protein